MLMNCMKEQTNISLKGQWYKWELNLGYIVVMRKLYANLLGLKKTHNDEITWFKLDYDKYEECNI